MKKKIILIPFLILLCAGLTYLIWPYAFTVVPIQEVEQVKESEKFDPVSYVDSIWDSKLIPTFLEKSADLSAVLNEMNPDENGTASKESLIPIAQKYGLITVGEAHVYAVKGTGQVVGVNTKSSIGTIEVKLDGYSGPIKPLIYIGTRIPSDETSVRDAVGFISFGDFREQTEYGKVAAEINKRVTQQVLSNLDKTALEGKKITFYGAFTIRTFNLIDINLKEVKIVPVQISLVE